ncbi:hypothetical protein ACQKQD_32325 [Methylobacterium sp. NPDC080182]|uniref:hypothetical protein n=1 Tax=Methylobacterium sp. NPDC080182 TaxID=3390590 RepID=UPI003D012B5E
MLHDTHPASPDTTGTIPASPGADTASTMVGIGVRIVPAGTVVYGGRTFVRAALLLSPVDPTRGSFGTQVALENWPAAVEALMGDVDTFEGSPVKVIVAPANKEHPEPTAAEGMPSAPAAVQACRALSYDRLGSERSNTATFEAWRKERKQDVATTVTLWQALLGPKSGGDWAALGRVIKPQSDTLLDQLQRKPVSGATGAAPETTLAPATPGGPATTALPSPLPADAPAVPDVAATGRGEAALLLTTERARSLLERLKAHATGGKAASRPINLAYEPFDPLDWGRGWPSWAGPIPSLVRYASAGASDAPLAKPQCLEDKVLADNQATTDRCACRRPGDLPTWLGTGAAVLKWGAGGPVADLSCAVDTAIQRHETATTFRETAEARKAASNPPTITDEPAAENAARLRFVAIQSQPSLARLFNLVVDVLIPSEAFGTGQSPRFAYVTAFLGTTGGKSCVWTATKLRDRPKSDSVSAVSLSDAWVCTRSEIEKALGATPGPDTLFDGQVEVVDGFLPLACEGTHDGVVDHRFDLVSIDVAQATDNRSTALLGGDAQGRQMLTLRTAGLAVFDHGRRDAAVDQLKRSMDRSKSDGATGEPVRIVDAADLTVGYRLDVGVRPVDKQGKVAPNPAWRDLCRRTITFGDPTEEASSPTSAKTLGRLLAHAIPRSADRAAFDSATLVLPARLQDRKEAGKPAGTTAFVDETVAQWPGTPLGVDTDARPVALDKAGALPLAQTYALDRPADGAETGPWRIPRLVLGCGYHVRLRSVLAGGIVRPVASPAGLPLDPKLALPAVDAGARRHLRHERIEAPMLATPQPMLDRPLDGVRDGPREGGTTVVLRSRVPKDPVKARSDVEATHGRSVRIVVPPTVPAAFVESHRLSLSADDPVVTYRDDKGRTWEGARDGLRDVDFDHESQGGFPVWTFEPSSDGRLDRGETPQAAKPNGDSVFRPRLSGSAARRLPYYPEPLADYLVLQIRRTGGDPLPGVPLIVPVRGPGVVYPDVRPIAIEVVARSRSGHEASHERVIGVEAETGTLLRGSDAIQSGKRLAAYAIDAQGSLTRGNASPGRSVAVTRVRLDLEPGDTFDVELWFLPSRDDLARYFDVVETATLLSVYDPKTGKVPGDDAALAAGIASWTAEKPEIVAGRLSKQVRGARVSTLGQRSLPGEAIRTLNDSVYDMACRIATPEIAASLTLHATHAVDRPLAVPSASLSVQRLSVDTREQVLDGATPPADDQFGASGVLVTGTVTFDQATTGFIEVVATGAGLVSGSLDRSDDLKRSADQVVRGLWPIDPASGGPKRPTEVYGFDIAPDGTVTFPQEQAVLLRIDSATGAWPTTDLLELQRLAKKNAQSLRATYPFEVGDTRARVLDLHLRAGSRTSPYFREPETGRVLPADATLQEGPSQRVPLRSTKAPAQLVTRTILPSTRLIPGPRQAWIFELTQQSLLCLSCRRPGATSGFAERIGVALWPPDLHLNRIADSNNGVERDYDTGTLKILSKLLRRDIDMGGFADEDLGPGGAYVTRWGRDPIKGGPGPQGWLIPPAAFPGLSNAKRMGPGVSMDMLWDPVASPDEEMVYVPRVSLRLPAESAERAARATTLEVALLTFRPRFDADEETWFVNIPIDTFGVPEPFVRLGLVRYQPFAAPDLQLSDPVVEWAQVRPGRHVVAEVSQTERNVVSVTVTGAGALRSATEADGHDPTRLSWWRQRPLMRIRLLRRSVDGTETPALLAESGPYGRQEGRSPWAECSYIPATQDEWTRYLVLSNTVKPKPAGAAGPTQEPVRLPTSCAIRPEPDPGGAGSLRWCAKFRLAQEPLADPEAVYSVFVEEVEAMRPATYHAEPVDETAAEFASLDQLEISGPRFAARLELTKAVPRNGQ